VPRITPDEAARARFLDKLAAVERRYVELETRLADPQTAANSALLIKLKKEHGSLSRIVPTYRRLREAEKGVAETAELAAGPDEELAAMAKAEGAELAELRDQLFDELIHRFAIEDEEAHRNVIVEIRAGTGGEEAALFASDLFGMYRRYCEKQGWTVEVMDSSPSEMGGYREMIFSVAGQSVNQKLRYESGGHRVQRVPVTETQGRIHTSACTVAVLPEAEEVEVDLKMEDVRMDFYRAGGPGGQKVNKTSSAVRLTHNPTGIVVAIQDEKSQHKNRSKALRILRSRLYDHYKTIADKARQSMRVGQIGSGDRSERIRTYNFPQNRVTDHRINLSVYGLDRIILGDLDEIIDALVAYDSQQRIKTLLEGDLALKQ
jgi:peptide chain release factor 1